ncbi:MAG: hypothetical protein NTX63_01250 [Candidatus Peregrinibacteria bacterium]|nr:hypothetical protein [Candidatus Peregrinibacteria bacterium]
MSDSDKHLGDKSSENGIVLPTSFIEVYFQLTKKGWQQGDTSNEAKGSQKKGTIEVQRLVLEKPCSGLVGNVQKMRAIMTYKDGKVTCQMYTDPFVPYLYRESTKDIGSVGLFMQEIDDYEQLINPPSKIEGIRRVTKEAMKTTQRLVRGEDGILRAEKD